MKRAAMTLRRTVLATSLLLLAGGGPAVGQEPVPWIDSGRISVEDGIAYYADFVRAIELYAEGGYEEAIPLLRELVERQPGDAEAWFRLGRASELTGRGETAIEGYRGALALGYRFTAWVAHRMALLHAEAGRADSAMVWLERALAEGWDDRPSIGRNPGFAPLRVHPDFQRVAGELPPGEFTRDEGWRYDIAFLVSEARRMHSGPDRPAFSAAFDSAAADLHRRIPELSDDEIVWELRRLVVLLGDGHTGIYGPGPDSPLEFRSEHLPLLFYRFDDGLYVVDAAEEARRWIGSRVERFGPLAADEVLAALPRYTHADNPMTPTWLGVRFLLPTVGFLRTVGAADTPDRATLTLRDPEGEMHRVEFAGGEHEFPRKLRPPSGDDAPLPLYLREVDRNYWVEPLPEHDALYLQFNQVRDAEQGPNLAEFADSVRTALERSAARHLIVDVRHNNGGNNGLLRPLVRMMVWWEQAAPEHQIFVLAGRNTFSAAQNFISRVERWTDAVFVGEPSSSSPNFSGEETNVILPYSRVRGSISTRYWQESDPDDRRPWISPRVPVTLSSRDYFGNRDPGLDAVLRIIAESR